MILSDRDIKKAIDTGDIYIDPYEDRNLQPASYDLHLSRFFAVYDNVKNYVIDPRECQDEMMREIEADKDIGFVLHPGGFALGKIVETTGVGNDMVGRLEGKSSVGRLGVLIHVTAGFLDPGNSLQMTLELHNTNELPVILLPGMPIAQIAFERISSEVERPYGSSGLTSSYSGDTMPRASQMHNNYDHKTGEWK